MVPQQQRTIDGVYNKDAHWSVVTMCIVKGARNCVDFVLPKLFPCINTILKELLCDQK